MTEDDGIAGALSYSPAKEETVDLATTASRMQRTGYLDKDSATRRIIELEDECKRLHEALRQHEGVKPTFQWRLMLDLRDAREALRIATEALADVACSGRRGGFAPCCRAATALARIRGEGVRDDSTDQ